MGGKRVFVAGHNGMVGSAICRQLVQDPNVDLIVASRSELDLTRQMEVEEFFSENQVDEVYLAAAKVGGIYANNNYPADFIYENLLVQCNVIHAAHKSNVQKLLFLGSSCIYPKLAKQPISETELLRGALESTNEPYAIAKIAGIKLCESYNRQYSRDYRSIMPTNLYGMKDNFHPYNSHVVPALIRRFHEAKVSREASVSVWGSGQAMREFLFVDDMAAASIFVHQLPEHVYKENTAPMQSHINVGTGVDCSICELAEAISDVVGFQGEIVFDSSKPDGTPRKLLDVSTLNTLGWHAQTDLKNGLADTYVWFLEHVNDYRK